MRELMHDLAEIESASSDAQEPDGQGAGGGSAASNPIAAAPSCNERALHEQIAAAKQKHVACYNKIEAKGAAISPSVFRGTRGNNPAHLFAEYKSMKKVADDIFVFRSDLGAFYQAEYERHTSRSTARCSMKYRPVAPSQEATN